MDKNDGYWSSYTGPIGYGQWESESARKAYGTWTSIGDRCNNPNNDSYRYYGAKGIKRLIDSRTFMGWYLHCLSFKDWTWPTVGRIDHSKDYLIDNIEMQEMADNSRERIRRLGPRVRPRPVFRLDNNLNPLCWFESTNAASRHFKIQQRTVADSARRQRWCPDAKFKFQYANETIFRL